MSKSIGSTNQTYTSLSSSDVFLTNNNQFAVGTRFLREFPGHGVMEGRITSYNNGCYEAYYPEDGDSEKFSASTFEEEVEITYTPTFILNGCSISQATSAGGQSTPPSLTILQFTKTAEMGVTPSCPWCRNKFARDPSNKKTRRRTPIKANGCDHFLCLDCVENRQFSASCSPNKNDRTWLDCPQCHVMRSFSISKNPNISFNMCELVLLSREIQRRKDGGNEYAPSGRVEHCSSINAHHMNEKSLPKKRQYMEIIDNNYGEKVVERNLELKPIGSSHNPTRGSQSSFEALPMLDTSDVSEEFTEPKMICCNCCAVKGKEKYSAIQWQRGLSSNGNKKVWCRRCEEKSIIRGAVGKQLENFCVRIHVALNGRNSATRVLSTLIPRVFEQGRCDGMKQLFPVELTLDGYTRDSWSLPGNEWEYLWNSVHLRCLVGDRKLIEFQQFLRVSQKSAYGTYTLKDGTDGVIYIPYQQQPLIQNDSEPTLYCQIILGLGLDPAKFEQDPRENNSWSAANEEDYITPLLRDRLLLANRKRHRASVQNPQAAPCHPFP